MRVVPVRLIVLLFGASLGSVGWGAVLPFLYADVATARGLGASTAALVFSAFAVGSLLIAPLAGRLADGRSPVLVATASRLAMVGAVVAIMVAGSMPGLVVAALGYGASLAVIQPAVSVLVLELTPLRKRREIFAWQFIGLNLGLALGGVVGGHVVDLTTPDGARPAYLFAAACSLLSALLVAVAGRTASAAATVRVEAAAMDQQVGYRAVLRTPGVLWLLVVTALLTLACYAQFDSGLPAYALSVLDVAPATLGTAVALNAILVAVLTAPVVRMTRRVAPAKLLATCGVLWVGVWLVLAVPMVHAGFAAGIVVAGYALFSVGETMLAPVLTPLAAALAPEGAVGRTLAALTGAQTLATAVGPGLSGVLLALGSPLGFLGLQIACCVLAVFGARQLHRAVRHVHRDELALAR